MVLEIDIVNCSLRKGRVTTDVGLMVWRAGDSAGGRVMLPESSYLCGPSMWPISRLVHDSMLFMRCRETIICGCVKRRIHAELPISAPINPIEALFNPLRQ